MNKSSAHIFLFILTIFLTSCSFDKVTGIWSGSEEQVKRVKELEKQQKEINRQKYFTAFALVLMVIVITATYWMVG